MTLQVLVDADNVSPQRLQPLLEVFARGSVPQPWGVQITASGRSEALARLVWPAGTTLLCEVGWQRADLALAAAYVPDSDPLVLVTGDGDFGLLAARHPGPVLVVSGAASGRLREGTTVLDPVTDGIAVIARWLAAQAG